MKTFKCTYAAALAVLVIAVICMYGTPVSAAVTGVCSNCHTMHNSQGGVAVDGDGPNGALLNNDCLGCHTTAGTDPLDASGYPFVKLGSATDDNCLAGGFFQAGADTGDDNGNENHDIGATADPAGFSAAESGWYTGATDGLGCAGTNGCHGNQTDENDMAAISGGHHDPTAYRMLYVGATGVAGDGAADYEELMISTPATAVVLGTNANIYSAGVLDPSISELCAKCHGDFHNESGTTDDCGAASPWIRHPTDISIPTTWAIGAGAYTPDGDDIKNNPPGYDGAVYAADDKRATCISCHRAHGTENNDLLRWAYSTQSAGGGNTYGCLGCHDAQR